MADGIDIVIKDKIQANVRRKILNIGRSADIAYKKIELLKRSLNIGGRGLGNVDSALRRMDSSANRASGSVRRLGTTNVDKLKRSLDRTNNSLTRLEARAVKTARSIRSIAAVGFIATQADDALRVLDQPQNIQNKLRPAANVFDSSGSKDAIASQERLNELTRQLYDIADRSRTPVEALATSYRRFDTALQSIGSGQRESLQITETIAKALTLAGSTATESASALLQLSQAFNKGKLDGDEFRSVAENIPQILDALSTTLGISRTKLFDYSREGKITSDVLRKAFKLMASDVARDFDDLPQTIGQSLTILGNNVSRLFGQFNQRTGFTDGIVRGIEAITRNLPALTSAAKAAGAALLLLATPSILGSLTSLFSVTAGAGVLVLATATYFGFFANKIRIAGTEAATLQDYVAALSDEIGQLLNDFAGKDFFGDLFSLKGAQKSFDIVSDFINGFKIGLASIGADIKATFDFLSSLETNIKADNNVGAALGQVLINAARNALIEIGKFALKVFGEVAEFFSDALGGGLILALEKVAPIFDKMTFGATGFGKQLKTQRENLFKTDSVKDFLNIDTAIEKLDGLKSESNDMFAGILKSWEESRKAADVYFKLSVAGFDSLNDKVKKNADARAKVRIQAEKDASVGNPGSLRGDDVNLQKLIQAQNEAEAAARGVADQAQRANLSFAEAFRQVQGISQGLNSINADGFKQLVELQRNSNNKNITETVGNNPQAYLDQGIFTPGFIERSQKAVENTSAFSTATEAANQTLSAISQTAATAQLAIGGIIPAATNVTTSLGLISAGAKTAIGLIGQIDGTTFAETDSFAQKLATTISTTISSGAQQAGSAIASMASSASESLNGLETSAYSSGLGVGQGLSQGARTAGASISSMSSGAVSNLNAIETAANAAADALRRMREESGPGDSTATAIGFSSGGYTGDIGRNSIAGVVHGQEFVMPAGATKKYRPLLESMRKGRTLPPMPTGGGSGSSGGGTSMNVTVENYTGANIEVQQLSPSDVRIIAREEAKNVSSVESERAVSAALRNPNSRVSKSLLQTNKTQRRR